MQSERIYIPAHELERARVPEVITWRGAFRIASAVVIFLAILELAGLILALLIFAS